MIVGVIWCLLSLLMKPGILPHFQSVGAIVGPLLKLDILLQETGFKPTKIQRTKVYLTNSLEEYHPDTGTLWANALANEANEANHIKRDTPVMCIIGNPPYNGESKNKSDWIMNLMDSYKYEPNTNQKLQETNSKYINSDEYKFIRLGQQLIEKNGEGILAYICPHGFLDNPTFRGMRWNLLQTFDEITILDLHGNSKRNEIAPDGGLDQNVFDIMQGVSINFFVKKKDRKNKLATIKNFDLYGKRQFKYDFLEKNSLSSIPFTLIPPLPPMYYMIQRDFELDKKYSKGFSVKDLFSLGTIGVLTKNDSLAINLDAKDLDNLLDDFISLSEDELKSKYTIKPDSRDWKLSYAKKDVESNRHETKVSQINYRPFDTRYTFIPGKGKGLVAYSQNKVRSQMNRENIALICVRQLASLPFNHVFVSSIISEQCFISSRTKEGGVVFPIYKYKEGLLVADTVKTHNFNSLILKEIESGLGMNLVLETKTENQFLPIDLLDYIYAVLHSPSYRVKYAEFLKSDFPKIPYPKDIGAFWKLVNFGCEIRQIHLLKSTKVDNFITSYPKGGSNKVTRKITKTNLGYEEIDKTKGKVWINDEQYFDNVPLVAWEFYIGGYQPAQKWLKDRKQRTLEFDDILHYQKIIVALNETARLMQEIDKIEIE